MMNNSKLKGLFSGTHSQPLAMQLGFFQSKLADSAISPLAQQTDLEKMLDIPDVPLEMDIENGTAILEIKGVLVKGATAIDKLIYGAVDTNEIQNHLQKVLTDPTIDSLFLDIDSPGGIVSGIPETASLIDSISKVKPVMAFSDGLICSAAYFIASQATAIYSTPSAYIGSVGVYLPIIESKKLFEKIGLNVKIFRSGFAKGAGYEGTELTSEQEKEFQESIDESFSMFKAAVKAKRMIKDADMQGQDFLSHIAAKKGFIDSIASYETALSDLQNLLQ